MNPEWVGVAILAACSIAALIKFYRDEAKIAARNESLMATLRENAERLDQEIAHQSGDIEKLSETVAGLVARLARAERDVADMGKDIRETRDAVFEIRAKVAG